MSIESEVFNKKKPDFNRFPEANFTFDEKSGTYRQTFTFPAGDFRAEIEIAGPKPADDKKEPGEVIGTVIETEFDDVYQAVHVPSQSGEFVERVRKEYRKILEKIADSCYYDVPFKDDQANRIAQRMNEIYAVKPEFPWDDDTYGSAGVFRHSSNEKWFALIMHIAESKIEPEKYKTEEKSKSKSRRTTKAAAKTSVKAAEKPAPPQLDVINVKIRPEDGDQLRSENGIYTAFHMNKKSWITIRLDDTLSDDRVLELIAGSFALTADRKGSAGRRTAKNSGANNGSASPEQTGPREWIIPANPKYYDIVTDFDNNDRSDWKQGRGIEEGDIVYMYVAVPHQAILYRCRVGKTHIPYKYEGEIKVPELMEVFILDRYDKQAFPLSLMKEYHVTQVRGPRYMPEDLSAYIKEHHHPTT